MISRVFMFAIGANVVAGEWRGNPILTAQGLVDQISSTISLIKDGAIYSHDRVAELVLPSEALKVYDNMLEQALGVGAQGGALLVEAFTPTWIIISGLTMKAYEQLDEQVSATLSVFTIDFERRYPEQVGRIGATLIDKMVLIAWLAIALMTINCTLRTFKRVALGKSCCKPTTNNKKND